MITQHNQRVIYSDDGVLTDITLQVNPFRKGSYNIGGYVAGEDYIIVGSDLPFANKFIDIQAANSNAADIIVEIWDGNDWVLAVDILDETSTSGVSLSQDGRVSWKTDKDEDCSWKVEDCSEDIPLLSGTDIYCFYWLRFSFTNDLAVGTVLNHIGYKFSDDDQLFSQYPDLFNTQMLDCFEPTAPSGTKTDWCEQTLVAAQQIIRRMKSSGIVWTPAQILDYEILEGASIHKTAEIIYSALGQPYEHNRKLAQDNFNEAFDLKYFNTDKNKNARLDKCEAVANTGFMKR